MPNEQKHVSRKRAKQQFTTVGLAFIVYIIAVLALPVLLKLYLDILIQRFPILSYIDNDNGRIAVFYALLLFGTFIPFVIISKCFGVRMRDYFQKANISDGNLFLEFFVFFTLASISIFIAEGVSNYFGVTVSLIFNIGSVVTDTYFDNYLYIFIFIVASPIVEEMAFRGCLQRSLSVYGKRFALFVTSVIFALAHGNFVEMIPAFVMSVVLGMIAYKYRSIQPCIFVRMLFNALMYGLCYIPEEYTLYSLALLIVIYAIAIIAIVRQKYRFVTFRNSHQPWSVTGAFLSTPTIILSIVLFVVDSILLEIIL